MTNAGLQNNNQWGYRWATVRFREYVSSIDARARRSVLHLLAQAFGTEVINPNYGYASRRWLVSEMEGLPGLKA